MNRFIIKRLGKLLNRTMCFWGASLLLAFPVLGETLRSAAEPNYPPFSVVTPDSDAGGFSIGMLKTATQVMGLGISFKTAPWNQIKNEINARSLQLDQKKPFPLHYASNPPPGAQDETR